MPKRIGSDFLDRISSGFVSNPLLFSTIGSVDSPFSGFLSFLVASLWFPRCEMVEEESPPEKVRFLE